MVRRMIFRNERILYKRKCDLCKKEIISMGTPGLLTKQLPVPRVTAQELKQWLDDNRDLTLLDTRNDYEVQMGTFSGATHFELDDFCEFPKAAEKLSRTKPVVMFCTGGIRCEKAGLYLMEAGFSQVYQLEGGILNYFAEVGGAHYQGECFVFDERVALNSQLQPKAE